MKTAYKFLSLIIVFSFALTACSSLNLSQAAPTTSTGSTVSNNSSTPVAETGHYRLKNYQRTIQFYPLKDCMKKSINK